MTAESRRSGSIMTKVAEYRHHAAECRTLAGDMPIGAQRDQLLAMAEIWDRLAGERSVTLGEGRRFGEPLSMGEARRADGGSADP